MEYIEELGAAAKAAEPALACMGACEKNAVLLEIADRLERQKAQLIAANAVDISDAESNGM